MVSEKNKLVDFLATHDFACPSCQYNLLGLASPLCPECGREVEVDDFDRYHRVQLRIIRDRRIIRVAIRVLYSWMLIVPALTLVAINATVMINRSYFPEEPTSSLDHLGQPGDWLGLGIFWFVAGLVVFWLRKARELTARRAVKHQDITGGLNLDWITSFALLIILISALPALLIVVSVILWAIRGVS